MEIKLPTLKKKTQPKTKVHTHHCCFQNISRLRPQLWGGTGNYWIPLTLWDATWNPGCPLEVAAFQPHTHSNHIHYIIYLHTHNLFCLCFHFSSFNRFSRSRSASALVALFIKIHRHNPSAFLSSFLQSLLDSLFPFGVFYTKTQV